MAALEVMMAKINDKMNVHNDDLEREITAAKPSYANISRNITKAATAQPILDVNKGEKMKNSRVNRDDNLIDVSDESDVLRNHLRYKERKEDSEDPETQLEI